MARRFLFISGALSIILLFASSRVHAVPPEPDIYMAEFYLPESLDAEYQKESSRLLALCKSYNSAAFLACLKKHLDPKEWKVATVHEKPDSSSPILGDIIAVFRVGVKDSSDPLTFSLDFVSRGSKRHTIWVKDVGDWSYGIEADVIGSQDGWARLPQNPFPKPVWINSNGGFASDLHQFRAEVYSIKEKVVILKPVKAFRKKSKNWTTIPKGRYFIQGIQNGKVLFRAEIPSDMPCGEDVQAPKIMPPTYEADQRQFFDTQGRPLFSNAMGKGC